MNSSSLVKGIRPLATLVCLGVILSIAQSRDGFADLTRPVVVGILQLLGLVAVDTGTALTVDGLEVPWTSECSGASLFAVLLGLAVWTNLRVKMDAQYWIRLALVFPAALLANVLRVLTLIACRKLFFPAVESPQMHYFMGFIWIAPMVLLISPRSERSMMERSVEMFHAAAVLAWLSPLFGSPGGMWIVTAAILLLSQCRFSVERVPLHGMLTVAWLAVGVAIGLLSLESMWLSWLLVCPLVWPVKRLFHPSTMAGAAAVHPLLYTFAWGQWFAMGAIAWLIWERFGKQEQDRPVAPPASASSPRLWRPAWVVASLFLCLPFTASALFARSLPPLLPPAHLAIADIGAGGYELRLPDQPSHIRMVWYASQHNDRHHTVKVCLKYRGKELEEVADAPGIFTDSVYWMREFFIVDGQLVSTYTDYVRSTFIPLASAGAHIIFLVPKESMTPQDFAPLAQELARSLHDECATPPAVIAKAP